MKVDIDTHNLEVNKRISEVEKDLNKLKVKLIKNYIIMDIVDIILLFELLLVIGCLVAFIKLKSGSSTYSGSGYDAHVDLSHLVGQRCRVRAKEGTCTGIIQRVYGEIVEVKYDTSAVMYGQSIKEGGHFVQNITIIKSN